MNDWESDVAPLTSSSSLYDTMFSMETAVSMEVVVLTTVNMMVVATWYITYSVIA